MSNTKPYIKLFIHYINYIVLNQSIFKWNKLVGKWLRTSTILFWTNLLTWHVWHVELLTSIVTQLWHNFHSNHPPWCSTTPPSLLIWSGVQRDTWLACLASLAPKRKMEVLCTSLDSTIYAPWHGTWMMWDHDSTQCPNSTGMLFRKVISWDWRIFLWRFGQQVSYENYFISLHFDNVQM